MNRKNGERTRITIIPQSRAVQRRRAAAYLCKYKGNTLCAVGGWLHDHPITITITITVLYRMSVVSFRVLISEAKRENDDKGEEAQRKKFFTLLGIARVVPSPFPLPLCGGAAARASEGVEIMPVITCFVSVA